ncbi:unnamed protein product [marine sediment metagenome]|uniref:Uncharacterized protein n=1 Tax=marine sediment metagenome TaxID=412755 RepID=X0T0V2_9ZZZZ
MAETKIDLDKSGWEKLLKKKMLEKVDAVHRKERMNRALDKAADKIAKDFKNPGTYNFYKNAFPDKTKARRLDTFKTMVKKTEEEDEQKLLRQMKKDRAGSR